ncbi:hypothetical protein DIU36_20380 [Mucilaginibacter rubeus]|nr:hypothetical protein DIU36_20380 [Mucilaginibacter rubeus]
MALADVGIITNVFTPCLWRSSPLKRQMDKDVFDNTNIGAKYFRLRTFLYTKILVDALWIRVKNKSLLALAAWRL